ncbi:MAG TPA: aminotransferase class I/II-fold pyridoxal phosphate-dependent enzyme [Kofleriaceae bacterium]|nr:aminotransferase class I/II-fold pyridoxal phosphate-dependent enzyme [Kofleriaceae bacterium]
MPRVYLSPPHLGGRELELLHDAVASNWIAPLGPHVDAFEREVAAAVGMPHALALASGTAALHLALVVAGVGPGDRVLVATLTFAASANAVTYVGAEPVFVDCDATWTIDPDLVAAELAAGRAAGRPYKAVIAVDLYGQVCAYDRLAPACAEHGATLVQDSAEALGSIWRGRPAGGQAALAVLSFNGNKIITTSGGGMLLGTDAAALARARKLSTQAREPAPHYEHVEIGFNYRMSNLLAAVGRAQLEALPARVAARRAVNARYRAALAGRPGIGFLEPAPGCEPNCWLTCLQVEPAAAGTDREALRRALEAADIEARPVWKPMHLQPVFAGHRAVGGATAARLFEHGLCLPSGSSLTEADQARVVEILLAHLR